MTQIIDEEFHISQISQSLAVLADMEFLSMFRMPYLRDMAFLSADIREISVICDRVYPQH